jgi:histone H2A
MATPRKSSKKVSKKSSKSNLIFPVGRIGTMLRKGRYSKRVSRGAATFLAASLEFLTGEICELASKTVKGKRITPKAINLAVRHDADLGALLQNVTISRGGVVGSGAAKKAAKKAKKAKKPSKAGKKSSKSSKSTPKA